MSTNVRQIAGQWPPASASQTPDHVRHGSVDEHIDFPSVRNHQLKQTEEVRPLFIPPTYNGSVQPCNQQNLKLHPMSGGGYIMQAPYGTQSEVGSPQARPMFADSLYAIDHINLSPSFVIESRRRGLYQGDQESSCSDQTYISIPESSSCADPLTPFSSECSPEPSTPMDLQSDDKNYYRDLFSASVVPTISRKSQLELYRQKRKARNFCRAPDEGRRQRALSRNRLNGMFAPKATDTQILQQLEESQRESEELKEAMKKLTLEIELLRHKSDTSAVTQQQLAYQLDEQRRINEQLRKENRFLWSSVPPNEVFRTDGESSFVDPEPYRKSIDFGAVQLNRTNSREDASLDSVSFQNAFNES